ncbi:tRNA-dihydrouridine synthase C [Shigella dysenteriae 1617]|uniref:tRNA-dihydrouridine synthase n=2 Tax=Shigella dysenteriae TaxID=622 RepID=A0A090NC90_SHIDY|nr:TRNA-dihydrouridine synthase [Shigella dysenteriae 1617]EFP69655.1 tRNA-dihydrouridine synthase C [Shigella dysenteriae 1617]ESU77430.1 TRNA-dihydrouridine synthase [Shigella dysenteriae WRSd3]ESU78716.1 TRNA-dihydrouridine synthase [Shigella dysenteriae WRSd5]
MQTFNPLTIGANIAPHFFAGDDMRVLLAPMVRVQLLGQFPQWLAENAARAVELGS